MNKLRFLKLVLSLGGLYYIIGAAAHFFGLTIFPFYDGSMYSPYHDTLIALVALILSMLLFTVARNPVKNIDALRMVMAAGCLGLIFSFWILWKVPTTELKHTQTIVETVLLGMFTVSLFLCYPGGKK